METREEGTLALDPAIAMPKAAADQGHRRRAAARMLPDARHGRSLQARLVVSAIGLGVRFIRACVESRQAEPRLNIERARRLLGISENVMGVLPSSITIAPEPLGAVSGAWIGRHEPDSRRTILFVHSGSFILGRTRASDALAARLALDARARVYAVDYRLAPEHPFPASIRDVAAAYRALLARGVPAASIGIVGESAGGGLALATLLALREEGTPMPGAFGALCPWADMTFTGPSIVENARRDPFMSNLDSIGICAELYLQGAPADHPWASPVFADLAGLPPANIHIGTHDMLRDDGRRIAAAIKDAGGTVRLDEWDRMPHGWQRLGRLLPESRGSVALMADFMRRHLHPAERRDQGTAA